MSLILFQNKTYNCREDETVLSALLRGGADSNFSCKNGVCKSCLLKINDGDIPDNSQKNLHQYLKDKKYFLPCISKLKSDISIELSDKKDLFIQAIVSEKDLLSKDIFRLKIEPLNSFEYNAGQFINLWFEDKFRSYSISNSSSEGSFIELHIKKVKDGFFSNLIFDFLSVGDFIEIQGSHGNCYYQEDKHKDKTLILIGTGTGLAPLYGILKDALSKNHKRDIFLYHGARNIEDFYLKNELIELSKENPNLHLRFCISSKEEDGFIKGYANDIAFSEHNDLSNSIIFSFGNGNMVNNVHKKTIDLKLPKESIFIESFFLENNNENDNLNKLDPEHTEEPHIFPEPDLEMWEALDNGKLLRTILEDFYTDVYNDELLSPYFSHTHKENSIQKQYNFLYQTFSGEDVFFGHFPRNGHHLMVISNELFDYRENIMISKLKKYNLPDHLIDRWVKMEEKYRVQIVKDKPWKKLSLGIDFPLSGYGDIVMEFDSICDGCSKEIFTGEKVKYHLVLGKIYCMDCYVE
jgi:NAD(P)H-flavin reductase/ferredoxin/truncated hemoglobin YjbI